MSIDDGQEFLSENHWAELGPLSAREFDVLRLLGQGFSNRDISKCLAITERTVKAHITSLLAKMRLESRLQAGLWAQRLGLGRFDGPRTRRADGTDPDSDGGVASERTERTPDHVQRSNGRQYDGA